MIEYQTLDRTPFEVLHAAWIQAFSDYQVTIEMPLWKLQQMTTRRGYSPAISMGAFVGGRLVGFTLNGVRDWNGATTVYDLGTGVIPEYRRKGITSGLFESLLVILREKGIQQYLLEVIQTNTAALNLYQKKGFEITREFACFQCDKSIIQIQPSCPIEAADTFNDSDWDRLAGMCDFQSSWQNSTDSVRAVPTSFYYTICRQNGEIVGYGIIDSKTGDIPQIAVSSKHRRKGIAASIMADLIQNSESSRIALINVDVQSEATIDFLTKLGFERFVDQYEMLLTL
jgi:ribosomal protein S18 acetylase RimI-like enzyme